MNEMKRLLVYIGLIASSYGCRIPNNCINGTCHIFNAKSHCTIGCKDGFAGIYCRERCEYTCDACLITNPLACTRCEEGRFGKTCRHKCSNCLNEKCYINGTCIEGCKSSWWGLNCDSNCERGYDCDRLTSPIGQGLESSTSFNLNLCPKHCRKINPPDDRICNSTTGQCLHGCEDGFTGSNCQYTFPEGTEVSSVLPKPHSSCPPPCIQCSDDGICLECTGQYGEICSICGPDGRCLDECGAGCADNNSHTESIIGDVPRDTWSQIDHLIKNNVLLLPLLCCVLVLVVIVTVCVTLKCRAHKRTQRLNMNPASMPGKQEEGTLFTKRGDIYHEIEDSRIDSHPPIPPVLEKVPGVHSSRQDQGHTQKLRRHNGLQSNNGVQGHNQGQGHSHVCVKGRRLDGAVGGRLDGDQVHRHNKCPAFIQVNIPNAEKENMTHQNSFVTNLPANQSYITPIQEVTQPDILSTKISNFPFETTNQKVRDKQSLDSKTTMTRSKVNLEQKDVISSRTEGSLYVTAIPEAEQRKLNSMGESSNSDISESLSPEMDFEGCKEQFKSLSAIVVDEGCKEQCESPSAVVADKGRREQCESPSAVVVDKGCREQCESPSAVVVDKGCREQYESPSAVVVDKGRSEQCESPSGVAVDEGCHAQCESLLAVVDDEGLKSGVSQC